MYRSNGNFEAFARPLKPEGVDGRRAYFVGSGLAALAGAAFLIRDAQMPGEAITVFEELDLPGGSMDGVLDAHKGFIIRGGREMEAHFETLWDLFRSIPSLDTPEASVLDEMYWLHKTDPSTSARRALRNRGQPIDRIADLTLTPKAVEELIALALMREQDLDDKRIDEVFTQDFFASNFWLYWATMFAFEPWASAMEMRRYILRFVHHISTLPDLSSLRFTRYNQYESLIRPLVAHLKAQGVVFRYGTQVQDVLVTDAGGSKTATTLELTVDGREEKIALAPTDLVFVTNGSITESSTFGDNDTPAPVVTDRGGAWSLWEADGRAGPRLRPSREVLRKHPRGQLDHIGHRHPDRRPHRALYRAHHRARSPVRRHRHRRAVQHPGFQLAVRLLHQPPTPFRRPGPQDGAGGLAVRPVFGQAGRLCQKRRSGNAPAPNCAPNGCIIWACRRIRSKTCRAMRRAPSRATCPISPPISCRAPSAIGLW